MIAQKLASAVFRLSAALCARRGTRFGDRLHEYAETFSRRLSNENFDMERNGERRALRILARHGVKFVFDVGANIGDWSKAAAEMFPGAEIHAFEVVPATFLAFEENTKELCGIKGNDFGLSDESGEIDVFLADHGTVDATACKIEGSPLHDRHYTSTVKGRVKTGAEYLIDNLLEQIDVLKIDVEGMDLKVIRGFGEELRRVRVIQFEYGTFSIASRDLLIDLYRHLRPLGFVIGKIYPRTVAFQEYTVRMENFHGGNFLAVRESETDLIRELATYGRV